MINPQRLLRGDKFIYGRKTYIVTGIWFIGFDKTHYEVIMDLPEPEVQQVKKVPAGWIDDKLKTGEVRAV